ncbi:uncharacterized protein MCYG_04352 [Microsporum canis CBS 113480]|uniref:Uncharacterized protein n=1 Tax=Arthroderma otae (strain ATCC MYA-4605 / CBS 113480) TaxID=554155 RepID=C5FPL7_ARTOC|nr:uncharacterized protein MCYG_04352 [Microsporum canis CBS 113480]EEQ31533.1 predicted protein [Microsporum canis CBS 113480]
MASKTADPPTCIYDRSGAIGNASPSPFRSFLILLRGKTEQRISLLDNPGGRKKMQHQQYFRLETITRHNRATRCPLIRRHELFPAPPFLLQIDTCVLDHHEAAFALDNVHTPISTVLQQTLSGVSQHHIERWSKRALRPA